MGVPGGCAEAGTAVNPPGMTGFGRRQGKSKLARAPGAYAYLKKCHPRGSGEPDVWTWRRRTVGRCIGPREHV